MDKSSKIAWGITLFGAAAIWWMKWRENRQSDQTYQNYKKIMEKYLQDPSLFDMRQYDVLPLGYRSNNPVNIRYSAANNWKGKVLPPVTGKYGQYEQFKDLVHGYRAALVLLRGSGYIAKGTNTIRKIITKFAPADDHNYTEKYITNVSRLTGIDPDTVISRNDRNALSKIVYAMSICENGYKDSDKNDIQTTYGLPNMDVINLAWELI